MIRLLTLILVSLVSLTVLSSSFAACDPTATVDGGAAGFLKGCSEASTSPDKNLAVGVGDGADKEGVKTLVITIANRVLSFGALFAIGAIVWSGIRYTTSAGDDEKTKSAKNTLIYAIIGLLLLLTAFPLVDILVKFIYDLGAK